MSNDPDLEEIPGEDVPENPAEHDEDDVPDDE